MNFSNLNIKLGVIEGLQIWTHQEFFDQRGFLTKTYDDKIKQLGGISFLTSELFFTTSKENVFRGLHFQSGLHSTSKIVTLINGSILDFTLDLRIESATYCNLQVNQIDGSEGKSMFIPKDVAHGYLVLKNDTRVAYRMQENFCPECDFGLNLRNILQYIPRTFEELILSERDKNLPGFLPEDFRFRTHS
jgi:dTDP-4-dehydrorhamnose 3,5-epimerase